MNDQLRQAYAALCQKLGDLQYKKSQIISSIEQVEREIYALNYLQAIAEQQKTNEDR